MPSIQAFAALGRACQSLSFAESITDKSILADLKDVLEEDSGRLDRLYDVTLDGQTFSGRADQRISLGKTRVFEFTISPNQIGFKPINSADLAEYADTDEGWAEIVEYAAKSGRSGMKLNCKPGNYQCGGACLNESRRCTKTPNMKQQAKINTALEKAGALAVVPKSGLASTRKTETTDNAAEDIARVIDTPPTKQDEINSKYASAKPTEAAIDGWQNEMLDYHTSPEGLALDEMTSKYHTKPGGVAWGEQPDYVQAIKDKNTFINATIQKEADYNKAYGDEASKWESYSRFTSLEREKLQKKVNNPKTSDKERAKAQKKLDDDRASSEAAAKQQSAKYNKSPEDRRKELEDEFDQAEKAATKESQKLQTAIKKGDAKTIQSEMERILRPLDAYQDDDNDTNVLDTRKRQRDIIREHLVEQSKIEKPESVLGVKAGATIDEVKKAYRAAASVAHPDKGGSAEAFQRVNDAFTKLRQQMNFAEFSELQSLEYWVVDEIQFAIENPVEEEE